MNVPSLECKACPLSCIQKAIDLGNALEHEGAYLGVRLGGTLEIPEARMEAITALCKAGRSHSSLHKVEVFPWNTLPDTTHPDLFPNFNTLFLFATPPPPPDSFESSHDITMAERCSESLCIWKEI